jgi:hypothetical protein
MCHHVLTQVVIPGLEQNESKADPAHNQHKWLTEKVKQHKQYSENNEIIKPH